MGKRRKTKKINDGFGRLRVPAALQFKLCFVYEGWGVGVGFFLLCVCVSVCLSLDTSPQTLGSLLCHLSGVPW